jgi:hypothetical protein
VIVLLWPLLYRTWDIDLDSHDWKTCTDDMGKNAPRWRMRKDLGNHIHRGMTDAEVAHLFGSPDQGRSEGRWAYGLKWDGSDAGSAHYFVVNFDSDRRVTGWRIDGLDE